MSETTPLLSGTKVPRSLVETEALQTASGHMSSEEEGLRRSSQGPSLLDIVEQKEKEKEINIMMEQEKQAEKERQKPLLDQRLQVIGSMFGVKPWQGGIAKTSHTEELEKIKAHETLDFSRANFVLVMIFRILWAVLFGWWIMILYLIAAALLAVTVVGIPYAKVCFVLALYQLWPFETVISAANTAPKDIDNKLTYGIWLAIMCPLTVPGHIVSFIVMWYGIFTIPMAQHQWNSIKLLIKDPSTITLSQAQSEDGGENLYEYAIYTTFNFQYYKYHVFGMNVMLFNLLPFIVIDLFFAYFIQYVIPVLFPPRLLMFGLGCLAVIPLAYIIGMALSALAAQTSFAIGAVLNASFGSTIELILWVIALQKGLVDLVQASVTGCLLMLLLFLPGAAMVVGGIRYPEMVFNPASAGVSSVLLILSMVGAFTPTLFYQIYGHHILQCETCHGPETDPLSINQCTACTWENPLLESDPAFKHSALPLSWTVSLILPIPYVIGLLFTLKTHSHLLDDMKHAAETEQTEAKWKVWQCCLILLTATILFAFISEELVKDLEPTILALGVTESFAGLTIIALIPNTTNIVNAIFFALHNNFSMSLEIGMSGALQVTLIELPLLTLVSLLLSFIQPNAHSNQNPFTLIFPMIDLVAIFFGVLIINYISINGKANYFEGSALLVIYILLIAAFFWIPAAELGSGPGHH